MEVMDRSLGKVTHRFEDPQTAWWGGCLRVGRGGRTLVDLGARLSSLAHADKEQDHGMRPQNDKRPLVGGAAGFKSTEPSVVVMAVHRQGRRDIIQPSASDRGCTKV